MRTQAICLVLAITLLCPFASAQWVHTSLPDSDAVRCFAVSGANVFAGNWGGVFLSTNSGTSWTATGFASPANVYALAVSGTNLFAGTSYGGVFLSTNNGASWTAANNGLTDTNVGALAVSGTNLFAVAGGDSVFLSTNNGVSWTAASSGMTNYRHVCALVASGTNLFAETDYDIFLSTNSGKSWTTLSNGLQNSHVYALAVSGTNLFASILGFLSHGGGTVFLSTNNGTSWTTANTPFSGFTCMAQIGTNLFAGTDGGVFLSTDNGTTWPWCGLTDTCVCALAVSGTNLLAGTDGAGVWRRPLSEMVSVRFASGELPTEFTLSQNYPNPFNPSTTIKYELPRASQVSLAVYDMLGREVSVLVNDRRAAGVHEVKFHGSNLASGVYFYRLQAGDFVQAKKLVILR